MCTKCYRCFRPEKSCYCKYIVPVKTKSKFIFLMHPKEAYKQKTGTGRLASLSLPGSEIFIGIDFTNHAKLNALLSDPQYFPLLLYPGDDACTADAIPLKKAASEKTLLILVVDATWLIAKKMMRLSCNLQRLQKLSFRAQYSSAFSFKRQPAAGCLSTIESCYYLIQEMQHAGLENLEVQPQPLMEIFQRMVLFQEESHHQRESSGMPSRYQNLAVQAEKRKKQQEFEVALEDLDNEK